MKKIIALLTLIVSIGLQISLHGQTAIEVSGTVKSSQGSLSAADITFLDADDVFQGNCVSGPDGKFRSQYKLQVGKTIRIKISKTGFEPYERTFKIDKTGNAGEFMLQRKILTITGFVKDSLTEMALQGAEIFFYNEDGKLIQSRSANSLGNFDLETGFTYGQKITVRISKIGYHDKEQTETFTSEGRNILRDILLPKIGDRGLRAFIRVNDKKKGKPLAGVYIHYFDKKKSTYLDTVVSAKGELELKLYQQPGTTLDLEISKPNYRTIRAKPTLSEDPLVNVFIYELEKDRRSALGPALLIGGGIAAVAGGGMYLSSNSKYESYKDFGNENRESDYDIAQSRRDIAVVAGGVAAGAILVYVIYKISQKNKEKDLEQKKIRTGFKRLTPLKQNYATANRTVVGIAYQF